MGKENSKYSALEIALFLIGWIYKNNIYDEISAIKLQYYLFYLQMVYLKEYDKPLFSDEIEIKENFIYVGNIYSYFHKYPVKIPRFDWIYYYLDNKYYKNDKDNIFCYSEIPDCVKNNIMQKKVLSINFFEGVFYFQNENIDKNTKEFIVEIYNNIMFLPLNSLIKISKKLDVLSYNYQNNKNILDLYELKKEINNKNYITYKKIMIPSC